jgi:hypothetical protein
MAQVLIDRPRHGSRMRGYRRQRCANRRTELDEAPKSEPIRHRHAGHDKYFNDLFGPLLRYLERNVGRPWSKVYSEICTQNNLRSAAQKHLRHHVFDFVACSVQLVDGVPYTADGRYPLGRYGRRHFYVCPKTGLLRKTKRERPRRAVGHRITVSKRLQYHRLEGFWCEVVLRPIPAEREGCWDAVLNKPLLLVKAEEATQLYGFEAYALSKRPLSRREARRLVKQAKGRIGGKRTNRSV